MFIRRLFYGQDYVNKLVCNFLLVISAAWGVLSSMLLSVDCGSTWYFANNQHVCPGLVS